MLVTSSLAQTQNLLPANPWQGKEIFQKKGCSQCHAIYGEGGTAGPDLGKNKFYGSYLQLAGLMWNHFPQMLAAMQKAGISFPGFNENEMTQLVSYLYFARYLGEPGIEFRGRKLLQDKGCVTCHRFGGVGGDLGPDISKIKEYMSPLLLAEALWNHGPQMMEIFEARKIKRPEFEGDEIVDVAAAIRSYMSPTKVPESAFALGDPQRGKAVFENKNCSMCHAVGGVGGRLGPDFAKVDFNYSVTAIVGRMWNHGPKMWKAIKTKGLTVPTFAQGDMADLIAYLYSLKLEDIQGDPQKGRQVLNEKDCLNCHSLQKEGTSKSVAPDLAIIGVPGSPLRMSTIMWNHAPHMQKQMSEKRLKWTQFAGNEMADLYAYLLSIRRK